MKRCALSLHRREIESLDKKSDEGKYKDYDSNLKLSDRRIEYFK